MIIGTTTSGAIPYYSQITTVDMGGLNDKLIARHGDRAGDDYLRPGHRVVATWRQLEAANVNLIIGHPQIVPRGALSQTGSSELGEFILRSLSVLHEEPLMEATLVSMPVDESSEWIMIYFRPHSAIDAKLLSGEWSRLQVDLAPE